MQQIKTITNRDAIFVYFEMLKQSGAKTVLDMGMFLKRIGAVTRQAMGCEIGADVRMYGIDVCPEIELPIYKEIYHEMITIYDFLNGTRFSFESDGKKADVAIMMELSFLLDEKEKEQITEYFLRNASGIVMDTQMGDWMTEKGMVRGYYPLQTGSSSYAWIPVDELRL